MNYAKDYNNGETYGLSEEDFNFRVENTIPIVDDLVPYSDPDYNEKVIRMAIGCVRGELVPDPEFEKMCEEHDKLIENGELEF